MSTVFHTGARGAARAFTIGVAACALLIALPVAAAEGETASTDSARGLVASVEFPEGPLNGIVTFSGSTKWRADLEDRVSSAEDASVHTSMSVKRVDANASTQRASDRGFQQASVIGTGSWELVFDSLALPDGLYEFWLGVASEHYGSSPVTFQLAIANGRWSELVAATTSVDRTSMTQGEYVTATTVAEMRAGFLPDQVLVTFSTGDAAIGQAAELIAVADGSSGYILTIHGTATVPTRFMQGVVTIPVGIELLYGGRSWTSHVIDSPLEFAVEPGPDGQPLDIPPPGTSQDMYHFVQVIKEDPAVPAVGGAALAGLAGWTMVSRRKK